MKLTREQFDEIGPFYLDDFCIEDDQDVMFRLFKTLPWHIQCIAIEWECGDTVFRDEAFTYLCKTAFDMTTKEYYKSEVFGKFKEYLKGNNLKRTGMPKLFEWSKLENDE